MSIRHFLAWGSGGLFTPPTPPVASNFVASQLAGPILNLSVDSDVPAYLGVRAGRTTAYTEIPWVVSGSLGTTGRSVALTPIDGLVDGVWHYQYRLQTPSGGVYTSGDFTVTLGSSVVLLLGNNSGTASSTAFTDQSASAHTITNPGSGIQWSALNAPSGYTTWVRNFGAGRFLKVAAGSGDFAWPAGTAFTIEWESFINSYGFCFLLDTRTAPTDVCPIIIIDGTGHIRILSNNGVFDLTSTGVIPTGSAVHCAWSRTAAGVSYIAINGAIDSSMADTSNYPDAGISLFESYDSAGFAFCGDGFGGFKVTKGDALYTASYTPPTLPLSA